MYLRLSKIRRGSKKPISDFAELDPADTLQGAITVAAALREPLGIILPVRSTRQPLDFQISRSQPHIRKVRHWLLKPRILAACG
jgi:hypothetical protein